MHPNLSFSYMEVVYTLMHWLCYGPGVESLSKPVTSLYSVIYVSFTRKRKKLRINYQPYVFDSNTMSKQIVQLPPFTSSANSIYITLIKKNRFYAQ